MPTLEPGCADTTTPAFSWFSPAPLGGASTEPESPVVPRPGPFLPDPDAPAPDPVEGGGGITLLATPLPKPFAFRFVVEPPDPEPPTDGGGGTTCAARDA